MRGTAALEFTNNHRIERAVSSLCNDDLKQAVQHLTMAKSQMTDGLVQNPESLIKRLKTKDLTID